MGELGRCGEWGCRFLQVGISNPSLDKNFLYHSVFWGGFSPTAKYPYLGMCFEVGRIRISPFLVIGISTRTLAVEFHVLGEGDSDRVEGCLTDGEGMEWNVGKRFGMGGLGKLKT